jgi:hypothetical protein
MQAFAATGTPGGFTLDVAIQACEAVHSGDCAVVARLTTPDGPAGQASMVNTSVSGRNIRLQLTVTNPKPLDGNFAVFVSQGKLSGGGLL